MKASIEIGVYQDIEEDESVKIWSKHYSVIIQYGAFGGDSAHCCDNKKLEWVLREFEQECLNRGIREIEIFNYTSLNILGFFCGQFLEGKELRDEKISNEEDEE